MATVPKVKITFDADFDDLKRGVKGAADEVDGFGGRIAEYGKKAAAAFAVAAAAAAAYATKLAIDGVKAAIDDEKSQTQLRIALEKTTGATELQTKAVEAAILKMSLQTGVADDKLRPSLARLLRSTEDITKAQDLLSLALDISTATGKPLEAVSNALGKAYDGQTTALGKLGLGLSSAELKGASFKDVQSKLSDLFGGAAAANAETYSGKIERMKVAFKEAQEGVGYALLPILEKFMGFINTNALPAIQNFSKAFSADGGLMQYLTAIGNTIKNIFSPIIDGLVSAFDKVKDAIGRNKEAFATLGAFISDYVAPVIGKTLGTAFNIAGSIASTVVDIIGKVIKAITPMINLAIEGINKVITGLNFISPFKDIPYIPKLQAPTIPTVTMPKTSTAEIPTFSQPTVNEPVTGGVTSATTTATKVASYDVTGFAANSSLAGFADYRSGERGSSTVVNATINMGLVGDPESAARAVVDALNQSTYRGTGGSSNLVAV